MHVCLARVASIWGSIGTLPGQAPRIDDPSKVRMWGLATQAEYRAVEDKLRIQFGHGWASGDPNVEGLSPGSDGPRKRGRPVTCLPRRWHGGSPGPRGAGPTGRDRR